MDRILECKWTRTIREIARRQHDAVGARAKHHMAERRWPILRLQRLVLAGRAVLLPDATPAAAPASTALARGPWNRGENGEACWRNVVSFL